MIAPIPAVRADHRVDGHEALLDAALAQRWANARKRDGVLRKLVPAGPPAVTGFELRADGALEVRS